MNIRNRSHDVSVGVLVSSLFRICVRIENNTRVCVKYVTFLKISMGYLLFSMFAPIYM